MIIAYYVIGTTLAAWLMTGNSLHWTWGLLVLPLTLLTHYLHGSIAQRRAIPGYTSRCLACRTRIGLFRRFSHQRFCSEEHEQLYLSELQTLAITRLHDSCAAGDVSRPVELPSLPAR